MLCRADHAPETLQWCAGGITVVYVAKLSAPTALRLAVHSRVMG